MLLSIAGACSPPPIPVAIAVAYTEHDQHAKQQLEERIAALVHAADPHMRMGVQVVSAHGIPLLELQANKRFVPASTLKLLTAAAALRVLGPLHRFETALWADRAPDRRGAVEQLYLQGTGDPALREQDLLALADVLRQQQVRRIRGDLVIDDTAFDTARWGTSWAWDDRDDDFSAPVGALNLHGNAITWVLAPGPNAGAPALVQTIPATPYVQSDNRLRTVRAQARTGARVVTGPLGEGAGLMPTQRVEVLGNLALGEAPLTRRFAVNDGGQLAGWTLREILRRQGIAVEGEIRRGTTPADAFRLATHQSPALATQLTDFVKASDNHGMECLIKRMGVKTRGCGTWMCGLQAVGDYLANEVGLELAALAMVDGSGLARTNLLSPAQLVRLLQHLQKDLELGPVFVGSLPVAGVDGTLESRFRTGSLRGRVRAKTGTMGGVSCLAGYMTTQRQELVTFAIMMNGFVGPAARYRKLQEQILALIDQV